MATLLPEPGFSPREVERICGLSEKYAYKLIKSGKLEAYLDCAGGLKVHPHEVYSYLKKRDKRRTWKN